MKVYQIAEELNDAMKMEAHGRFGSHEEEWRDARVDGPFPSSCKLCTATAPQMCDFCLGWSFGYTIQTLGLEGGNST
jgi:hypothetical protein